MMISALLHSATRQLDISPQYVELINEFILELDTFLTNSSLQVPGQPTFLEKHLPILIEHDPNPNFVEDQLIELDAWIATNRDKVDKAVYNRRMFLLVSMALNLGLHALQAPNELEASNCLGWAQFFRGRAQEMLWAGDNVLIESTFHSKLSKKGADAANVPNEILKVACMAWLDENGHKIKGVETTVIALMEIEPVKWGAAKKYVQEWRRKKQG